MGQKLVKLYEFTRAQGGVAVARLSMKTLITADKAAAAPDSPEILAKTKAAIKEITGKDAPAV